MRSSAPCGETARLGPRAASERFRASPRGAEESRTSTSQLTKRVCTLGASLQPWQGEGDGPHSPDEDAEAQRRETGSKDSRTSCPDSLPRVRGFETEQRGLERGCSCTCSLRPASDPIMLTRRFRHSHRLSPLCLLGRQCFTQPHRNQGPAPTHCHFPRQTATLTREPLAMRSPGATGPAELSVTGRRYSSGWAHSQRLKLRAKASGYCSPRQRETGVQGHRAILNSPCLRCGWGAPRDIHDGPRWG